MQNNSGSFGAAAGGMSPELQAAISRRSGGNPGGPMAQTTAGAPTNSPTTQLPASSPAPTSSPSPATSQSVSGISAGLPGKTETKIIIDALNGRLKSLSKIQEMGGNIE